MFIWSDILQLFTVSGCKLRNGVSSKMAVTSPNDAWLIFLLLAVLTNAAFVPEPSTLRTKTELRCPDNCRCAEEDRSTSCYLEYSDFSLEDLAMWKVRSLELYKAESMGENIVFPSLQSVIFEDNDLSVTNKENYAVGLPYLAHLHISDLTILQIRDFAFAKMSMLQVLELRSNKIEIIHRYAFAGLKRLANLSLHHNNISVLPRDVFHDLVSLVKLDLRENHLKMLPEDIFAGLSNLQILDLSLNALIHVEGLIDNLTSLRYFRVSDNHLTYILNETVNNLLSLEAVDISRNPFVCSCAINELITATQQNTSTPFTNTEEVTCARPWDLTDVFFKDIKTDFLPCEMAKVDSITDSTVISYQFPVVLNCTATGSPPLAVYWQTPWGDNFSHPSMQQSMPAFLKDLKYDNHYSGVNLPLVTRVYVSENGSLHIDHLRGYFTGNFTCLAVNLIGTNRASLQLQISTKFRSVYISSLYVSGICAVSMFIIAVIIGSIRWCVSKCFHEDECQCCCCGSDEFVSTKDIYKVESEEIEVINGEIYYKSNDDDDKDFYEDTPPKTPLNSPAQQTPGQTPSKDSSPNNEPIEPEGWISVHIKDQLDEVKSRLRYGAERKMQKVKSLGRTIHESSSNKIKTIKETGSLKIQSIKETSSLAASAVMKSVESGMEQVKYGYQSIKEFCGTSDLGPGTISMMSVTTDVDTKEQVRVVKSHTFV